MTLAIVLGILVAAVIAWLAWRRAKFLQKARVQFERRAERQKRRVAEWAEMEDRYGRTKSRMTLGGRRKEDKPVAETQPEADAAGEG
jgi:hypothetical protein